MALDADATRIRGTWIKHAAPGLPPLPSRTDPPDNRWQRGSVVDTFYLADARQPPWPALLPSRGIRHLDVDPPAPHEGVEPQSRPQRIDEPPAPPTGMTM